MQPNNVAFYRRLTIIIPVLAGFLLLVLTMLYFRYEKRLMEQEKYSDLKSIGKLKATQLEEWYTQRTRDALYMSQRQQLPADIKNYLNTGNLSRSRVINFIKPLLNEKQYEEILITLPEGDLIFSLTDDYKIDSITYKTVHNVIESKSIVVNDLYYCTTHQKIHHDVMAPVFDNDTIIAILVLRTDPSKFLYPYIQEWPVPSKTAETILAKKVGDSVIFLNEMKKIPNTALKYKLPVTDLMVPAVRAVLGGNGMFWGYDYNGEKVLSDIRHIDGTPWSMVVKIDKTELFDGLASKTILIGILALMTIIIISGTFIFSYYKRETLSQNIQREADHQIFAEELKNQVAERTSELERTYQDLLNFAHIASHDLSEPVRKIKTFLSMITKEYSDNLEINAKKYLGRIEIAANRLESIIEGVFQYSGIHNTKLDISQVDLNEIISSILLDLELQINSKKVEFEICQLPLLEGSKIMMYQLFYNLINNSLKFSKEDEIIKISICSQNVSKNDILYVKITIQDNGIGFEPEYSHSIFETFKRLHSKDNFEGSGLGLALCKRIVQKHNGSINATGNPGSGAVFNLLLPLKQPVV